MNILTFDTEEWYLKKARNLFRDDEYQTYDSYLGRILDLLDERQLKASFFCLGGMAREFPEIVRRIADKGHEIGCHSDEHVWLNKLTREELKKDTETAIKSLEDVVGKKVVSFRAPAFSIGEQNKWALEVLAECGIERDASIFPAARDFGGFNGFPAEGPCVVKFGSSTIKEFPVPMVSLAGKQLAYSGGGYFRFFPQGFIKNTISHSDYVMTYFHISDLMHRPMKMMGKERFEEYYKVSGTLKNRMIRMFKTSCGTKGAFDKMCSLVEEFDFVSMEEADRRVDWEGTRVLKFCCE